MKKVVKDKKTTNRKVKNAERFDVRQTNAVIALYEALAPNEKTREIDVEMIWDAAFPIFEETVGEKDWRKVKCFFGIEKGKANPNEIPLILNKLRTVENAIYYIDGYSKLINDVADCLVGVPDRITTIVRAKMLRMYVTIFLDAHFFPNELRKDSQDRVAVDFGEFQKNNSRKLYPEDLFWLYEKRLINQDGKKVELLYTALFYELEVMEKRLKAEVLSFAELQQIDGGFISVNKAYKKSNFTDVRNLKQRVNEIPNAIEYDRVANLNNIQAMDFEIIYYLYKFIKYTPFEEWKKIERERVVVEKGNPVLKKFEGYMLLDNLTVSSKEEAERLAFMFENAAYMGLTMKAKTYTADGNDTIEFDCVVGVHWAAMKFAHYLGIVKEDCDVNADFNAANELIEKVSAETWMAYLNDAISNDEMKELLQIKEKETPYETVCRLATNAGYLNEADLDSAEELIKEVILPGNEDAIKAFSDGEITEQTMLKRIGFEKEFAQMYFDYRKIDIPVVEEKLQEIKRSYAKDAMQKSKLLVSLYCHVIENKKKCGPKMKVPKGNKALKPANLRARIC